MGVFRADNIKIWRNLPISKPKPDLHNIKAHTKFGENPLMFKQVIIWKQNRDGGTVVWLTDGHTDVQGETKIHRHYCMAGYKTPVTGSMITKDHLLPVDVHKTCRHLIWVYTVFSGFLSQNLGFNS